MVTQNIFVGLLGKVNTDHLSEAQLYTLYILLTGNILLVILLIGLPLKLFKILQRIQSHRRIEENTSGFQGIKKETGVFSVFPNVVSNFIGRKMTIPPEHTSNTKDPENPSVVEDPERQKENQWYCVGASIQGTSHKDIGLPCQDAHRFHHLANGTLIIAVADGVGSAEFSKEGANLACEATITYLTTYLENHSNASEAELENALRNTYLYAVDSIQAKATTEEVSLHEYATTLIVGVITDTLMIGAMVGDGMMVVEDMGGEFSCLFSLPKREYANQVVAITSAYKPEEMQIEIKKGPVKTVSILTDGLLRLSCDVKRKTPHAPFFQTMTSLLYKVPELTMASQDLQTLLNHPWINERTDDDKTLVMAANIRLDVGEEGRSDDL